MSDLCLFAIAICTIECLAIAIAFIVIEVDYRKQLRRQAERYRIKPINWIKLFDELANREPLPDPYHEFFKRLKSSKK